MSGLTASIALEQSGRMTSGETVLVTGSFLKLLLFFFPSSSSSNYIIFTSTPLSLFSISSHVNPILAAAGGTGLYAVQLAKLAGNHVCTKDEQDIKKKKKRRKRKKREE